MKQRRNDGTFGIDEGAPSITKGSTTVEREERGKPRGKPFQKGAGKPANSGRKKGTPNKWSQVAAEIMERRGINPIEKLCDLVEAPGTHPDRHLRALIELCKYAYPQKKELSGEIGLAINEISARLIEGRRRVAEAKKKSE
jgi:hypothetical protein